MVTTFNSDLSSNADNFYSPISASGYLTPLQRKKLREKRNIEISPDFNSEFVTPKNKKLKQQNIKPQSKAHTKKGLFKKKQPKTTHPESRTIASDLLVKGSSENNLKDKKFFKSRSPLHLKKAKFSMLLTTQKKRLKFGNQVVLQNSVPSGQIGSDPVNDLCEDVSQTNAAQEKQQQVDTNPNAVTSPNVLKDNNQTFKLSTPESKDLSKDSCDPSPTTENSVIDENKEVFGKGIFDFDWPSDEVLLERQNRARSLFKKSKPVIVDCDQESKMNNETAQCITPPKLYPIFNKGKRCGKETENKRPCLKKSPTFIKDSSNGGEQMFIDAGQKEIGAKVCPTCNMIYTIAQEEDENLHSKYHNTYLINLKFLGWKEECIVGNYDDGRIILIKETDKHFKLKKVQDVLFIANRDLGFPSTSFPSKSNVMFLLFISNEKRVCGCLVAESIELACPVVTGNEPDTVEENSKKTIWKLGNWYASTNPVPAICGINRIWVSKNFRRRKVGSRMLDCLRQNFLFGHIVSLDELAFTDPSPDGRQFAASYTGTNYFLVYK